MITFKLSFYSTILHENLFNVIFDWWVLIIPWKVYSLKLYGNSKFCNLILTFVFAGFFLTLILSLFVYYFHMLVNLFYVSDQKPWWLIFNVLLLNFGIYTLHRCKSNINFRFRNFMIFDTHRLYIASLFNFDCNCHVDLVCIKLKYKAFCNFSRDVK